MIDFPDDERKPLKIIQERKRKKQNLCLCYEEEGLLKGYGIFEFCEEDRSLLMDYFAVFSKERNQGTGTRFLEELKEYFKDWNVLFIESESVCDVDSKRRLDFYQKCGAVISGVRVNLFHVDYEILFISLKEELSQDEVEKHMRRMYEKIYPKVFQMLYLKWIS